MWDEKRIVKDKSKVVAKQPEAGCWGHSLKMGEDQI